MNMLDVRSSFDAVLAIARGTADNDTQQQPDLAVYDYHRGGAAPSLLDGVVTDPTAPSYRVQSSRRAGTASAGAERRKRSHHGQQAEDAGYRFVPFGIDVFGAFGPAATRFLEELTEHSRSLGRNDTRMHTGWSVKFESARVTPPTCRFGWVLRGP